MAWFNAKDPAVPKLLTTTADTNSSSAGRFSTAIFHQHTWTEAFGRLQKKGYNILYYLLVELDVLQHLDGLVVISQQRVQTQQPNQAEIPQHLVQGVAPIFTSHTFRVTWGKKEPQCHPPRKQACLTILFCIKQREHCLKRNHWYFSLKANRNSSQPIYPLITGLIQLPNKVKQFGSNQSKAAQTPVLFGTTQSSPPLV